MSNKKQIIFRVKRRKKGFDETNSTSVQTHTMKQINFHKHNQNGVDVVRKERTSTRKTITVEIDTTEIYRTYTRRSVLLLFNNYDVIHVCFQ